MYFRRLTQEEAMEMSREDGYEAGRSDELHTTLDKLILHNIPLTTIFDVIELPKESILQRIQELNPALLNAQENQ